MAGVSGMASSRQATALETGTNVSESRMIGNGEGQSMIPMVVPFDRDLFGHQDKVISTGNGRTPPHYDTIWWSSLQAKRGYGIGLAVQGCWYDGQSLWSDFEMEDWTWPWHPV